MRDNVCLTLPDALRSDLDSYARMRGLPRSYAAQELLERALAVVRPQLASAEHLRRHAELSGITDHNTEEIIDAP